MASLKLIFQTYAVIFAIPFLAFAINPQEPKNLCERLLNDQEKIQCKNKAEKSDWYAASACNSLVSDQMFVDCLAQIQNGLFNPEALDFCTQSDQDMDKERFECILSLKNKSLSQKDLSHCLQSKDIGSFKNCTLEKASRAPASLENSYQKK